MCFPQGLEFVEHYFSISLIKEVAMKNFSLLFIAFLLIPLTTLAQEGWFHQSSGTTNDLYSVHFIDKNNGWVGGWGTILNTTDGGENWSSQTSGTPNSLLSVYFIDSNTGWAVGGYSSNTILKTTDGGTNWNFQSSGITANLYSVHFADSNTGWIVGELGTLLKISNGGANWIGQSGSFFDNSLESVHFTDNNTGWAVGGWQGGIILNTTDGGENWNHQTGEPFLGLDGVYFTDSNTGWAVGGDGMILHTTNGGVSFVEGEEIDETPTDFSLSNNFPNPFNPLTKIKYSVPSSSNVLIKVFDILGNEIETLVNQEKTTGTYEITWYAEQLPSGVYFYKLQAGSFVETKKMVLMK
jgi:photosystem II stability/assembly factor-like uncharacterized protein